MSRIALEGLPGSGKTTLANMIASNMSYALIPEILYDIDTRSDHEEWVRHDIAKSYLFSNNDFAVMDRTFLSTLAVTYAIDTAGYPSVDRKINEALDANLLVNPDLVIYISITPEISLARQNDANSSIWFQREILCKVRDYYESVFSHPETLPYKLLIIDGTNPLSTLLRQVKDFNMETVYA